MSRTFKDDPTYVDKLLGRSTTQRPAHPSRYKVGRLLLPHYEFPDWSELDHTTLEQEMHDSGLFPATPNSTVED